MSSSLFLAVENELRRAGVTVYGIGHWRGATYAWVPDDEGGAVAVVIDTKTLKLASVAGVEAVREMSTLND